MGFVQVENMLIRVIIKMKCVTSALLLDRSKIVLLL